MSRVSAWHVHCSSGFSESFTVKIRRSPDLSPCQLFPPVLLRLYASSSLTYVTRGKHPLAGIEVVTLVRIFPGPVMGTTLAVLGADVIRINCSRLLGLNLRDIYTVDSYCLLTSKFLK
jgi:Predicted acyl-CoA transferases/carnitine dehydratase